MKRTIALLLSTVILVNSFSGVGYAKESTADTGIEVELTAAENLESVETTEELVINNENYSILLNSTSFEYTGDAILPEVKVIKNDTNEELASEQYCVTYKNNTNVGTASVIVTKAGEELNETDEKLLKAEFIITAKAITAKNCALKTTNYVYDGNAKKPEVVVKIGKKVLAEGTDYELKYKNNIKAGTAKVIILAKGNYAGEITKTFKIDVFAKNMIPQIKITPSYGKNILAWKPMEGADGYIIQRRTAAGSFKTLYTTKKAAIVSYIDKKVKVGTTYGYRVCAYKMIDGQMVCGAYSVEAKQRSEVARVDEIRVSAKTSQSIVIRWDKVVGAQKYAVYRSTSEKGVYKRIGTVKAGNALKYTDKNRVCGRTYYYKVAAYRIVNKKAQYGVKSVPASTNTVPERINFNKKTTPQYTNITLKWNKSAAAEGYEVYRSEKKKGEYTLIKTVKSGKTLTYKDTGLVKHQKYFYKIRPYTVTDGNIVYGEESNIYSKPESGWKYKNGYKLYYNARGNLVKDVRNIIGKQDDYVIKVNKQRNTVTIYAKDIETGKYNVPVVAFICSCGKPTPIGTFDIYRKYRWKSLIGPSWGQWSCRYNGGKLFHSVYYLSENDPYTLSVSAYNDLGTLSSHGCIRLTARDAKWVYDNCTLGTKVVIYNSATSGPFGKPKALKLPSWHTWDPTDPYVKSRCKKYGCH